MTANATDDTAAITAATLASSPPAFIAPPGVVRVSTDAAGGQANGDSYDPAVSGNLRYVAFESAASNLLPGDANGSTDIFVKDLRTGAVTLASAGAGGTAGNGGSSVPSLSAAGRFVAFESAASNLVPGDGNGQNDIFVKDLHTGGVTLASADAQGTPGNAASYDTALSANGRFAAFSSDASNLVPGDANGTTDVFVKDLRTGAVTLASADAGGTAGNQFSNTPSLSADGRTVAFTSLASNLAPGDGNAATDVFVRDLRSGALTLASADASGTEGNSGSFTTRSALSADGRLAAFSSFATNLLPGGTGGSEQVFVKDLGTGAVTLASADAAGTAGDKSSSFAAISPNGRYVSFNSDAANLAPGDNNGIGDVFVKDLWTGGIRELTANVPSSTSYYDPLQRSAVTNTGAVAFDSPAGNLVAGDTNGASDIFLSA
jgi:Tol biopolymer transport system component